MEIVLEFLTKNCDKTESMLIGREAYPKYPAILFILIQIDDKGILQGFISFVKQIVSQLEA